MVWSRNLTDFCVFFDVPLANGVGRSSCSAIRRGDDFNDGIDNLPFISGMKLSGIIVSILSLMFFVCSFCISFFLLRNFSLIVDLFEIDGGGLFLRGFCSFILCVGGRGGIILGGVDASVATPLRKNPRHLLSFLCCRG